jgi:hypothetical protein
MRDDKNLLLGKIVCIQEENQGMPGEIRELSVTPVGYFTAAIENHSRGVPTGTILHGENGVFQSNMNDFPQVTYYLDEI